MAGKYNLNIDIDDLINRRGSEILDIMSDFEAYISSCASLPMTNKVVVSANEVYSFLEDMRAHLPKELEESTVIIREVQDIIELAEQRGDAIIDNANKAAAYKLKESRLIKEAEEKANEILRQAICSSENVKNDAESFVSELFLSARENFNSILEDISSAENQLKVAMKEI